LILSTIFTGAVGIVALVGASIGNLSDYVGCTNPKFKGALDIWNYLDSYLIQVDTNLCSTGCPCNFQNPAQFSSNATVFPSYSNWVKNGAATAFQNCSATVQNQALQNFQQAQPDAKDFNATDFANYWGQIESRFNCSGLCQTSYINTQTKTNQTMYKYMFSNINA
jgi:hypothetical protein